mgnify:CR=1 FL=1
MSVKSIERISVDELRRYPVWRFTTSRDSGAVALVPVAKLPCRNLAGRLVATEVLMSDGTKAWAMLGNIDTTNARLTRHFISLSVEKNGDWFHLARYHDHDYSTRGPEQLARFLGKDIGSVFPLHYDVRFAAIGEETSLVGDIRQEPEERLTRAEIVALAVP